MMKLPSADVDFLDRSGFAYRVFEEGGMLNVELEEVDLPFGLSTQTANVLFRLAPTYPDTPPDMWWVIPHLTTAGGATIPATEHHEIYDGRTWQRWSRHLDPGLWKSGIDGLESYVRILRNELQGAAV